MTNKHFQGSLQSLRVLYSLRVYWGSA